MFSIQFFPALRLSAFLAGLALIALAAATEAHAQSSSTGGGEATPDATVHVSGMACQMCARSMTNALEKLDAVEKADVQLEEQQALLTLKADKTITEEALREAVEGAGYEFRKVIFAEKTDASDAQ
jgi:copper chaperone CopZ